MDNNVINLDLLGPQEIQELYRTMTLDINTIQVNMGHLRTAHNQYSQSLRSIQQIVPSEEKKVESLIPLTSSLYMLGEIREVKKVLVDVGTGYFVEKPLEQAIAFFDSKVKLVEDQLDKLEQILAGKRNDLAKVQGSMNLRMRMHQQQQQQQQQAMADAVQ